MEPCEPRAAFGAGAAESAPSGGRRVKAAGIRAPEAASRYVLGLGFVLKGLCLLPVGATEGADGDGEL